MNMTILQNWALHAYADGELDGPERDDIERLIAASPQAQQELASIQRQKTAVKFSFGGVVHETVPEALTAAARRPMARRRSWIPNLAAALALLAAGAAGGWFTSARVNSIAMASLPERAFSAYEIYAVEVRHAVEVPASEQDHLQKWLSKRVGVPFKVPDLSDKGYSLLGGRLLADGAKPAGLLVYEDAAKKRLTIFVASNAAGDEIPFEIDRRGKLVTCFWRDKDLVYAFVGEKDAEDMKQLAQAAHDRFEG
jgi:anti-sigma factor RsiW